jgi:hypothetical protein
MVVDSFTNMAMGVKRKIGPLGFRHVWGTVWEALNGCPGGFPHEDGRFVHQNASKSLGGTRQMKQVEGVKMTEYLGCRRVKM